MGGGDQFRPESDRGALMRIAFAIAAGMLLAGCADEIAEQEARVAIVDRGRDGVARCTEHQKLAQLQLKALNEKRYTLEKAIADQICSNVQMERNLRRM